MCAWPALEIRRMPGPWLLRLNLFDVIHQIEGADSAYVLVRTHLPEDVAPQRHILRPMRGRPVGFTINDVLHLEFGEFAAVFHGHLSQIRRRRLAAGGGSVAFS